MQRGRAVLGDVCPDQIAQQERMGRTAIHRKEKALVPRSSSPVNVYAELPCIIEQAFSTIAWDDLEDCASVVRRDSDSLGSQVNESNEDDQDFGDYALDFMADSPATLESSLSPDELVPFQGCVVPLLTPQQHPSSEHSHVQSSTEAATLTQHSALWEGIAQCRGRMLGDSMEVISQHHETLHRKKGQIESLLQRNHHLRQLASRAKHLASALEKLMTVTDPRLGEPALPCGENTSLSPCKRQRLDEGYETESSDSVEDMLRDVSTRCNAVLHDAAAGTQPQQESETVRLYGAFSGLRTSISKDGSTATDGEEAEESVTSFRTSIREHCTIKTKVLPHGRAFTSRTQQGGYRFRWVPNHS